MLVHNRQDEPGVILHSEDLLDEMQDFGSLGGRFEGQGNHDDGCMGGMIGYYCMTETTVHLKGTANDRSTDAHTDDIREYGVFDHLNRQRGMYRDKSIAEGMIVGRPGWSVQPVLICKANTLWSPIYDDPKSPEYRLRHQYGMESDEITPQLVSTFREAYRQVTHGGGSNDPDW
jgi:hypothetical protein